MQEKRLYEVRIRGGSNHKNYKQFLTNVSLLNGKSPDVSGMGATCLISHHEDAATVHLLCVSGIRGKQSRNEVSVIEVTKKTVEPHGDHFVYYDMVKNYFLPYNAYPNIGKLP